MRTPPRAKTRSVVAGAIALLVALVLLVGLLPGAAQAVSHSAEELAFVQLLNDYRQNNGLQPLMVSDLLSDAAGKHSSDMAMYGMGINPHTTGQSSFFPAGSSPWDRMTACGYSFNTYRGENIAAGYDTAAHVFEAWRKSPSHNSHMVDPRYTVVGVGLVEVTGSEYGSYWTADFGGYVDPTAHWAGDLPDDTSATTTSAPTTTTSVPPTTTTTTTRPGPGTTTTTSPPAVTSTTVLGTMFADVPPAHALYEEISSLAADGVVSGCSDGLFHPENRVSRAQFAKIIVLALGRHTAAIDNAASPSFEDVPFAGVSYPFDYVEEASALRIIQGFADRTFRPGLNVTRIQLALMLTRAGGAGLSAPPASFFCPFGDVPLYAQEAVRTAVFNSLVDGKTSTVFDAYGQATRGQVAKMVFRLRQALAR